VVGWGKIEIKAKLSPARAGAWAELGKSQKNQKSEEKKWRKRKKREKSEKHEKSEKLEKRWEKVKEVKKVKKSEKSEKGEKSEKSEKRWEQAGAELSQAQEKQGLAKPALPRLSSLKIKIEFVFHLH
jgi:hypothetical protein